MFVESNYNSVNFSIVFDLELLFLDIALTDNLNYLENSQRHFTFGIVWTEPVILDKLLVK